MQASFTLHNHPANQSAAIKRCSLPLIHSQHIMISFHLRIPLHKSCSACLRTCKTTPKNSVRFHIILCHCTGLVILLCLVSFYYLCIRWVFYSNCAIDWQSHLLGAHNIGTPVEQRWNRLYWTIRAHWSMKQKPQTLL